MKKLDSTVILMLVFTTACLMLCVWRFITHGFALGIPLFIIFGLQVWNIFNYLERKRERLEWENYLENKRSKL